MTQLNRGGPGGRPIAELKTLHELLRLNTRLFTNCLDGFDDETARRRLSDATNNVAFIASHVLDGRFFLARYLGLGAANPFKEVLEGLASIEEITEFPLIQEILAAWSEISGRLDERFGEVEISELERISPRSFPIGDSSVLGGVAFLLQHESYHLGQLGLLRKCFGHPPMSFA